MEFEVELPKEKKTVWDEYVPIVEDDNNIEVFLTSNIDMPLNYNEMTHRIRTAKPGTNIKLHITNYGGIIDSAFMIRDAIKNSKATVTAKLYGNVMSSATVIALSCDKLELSEYITFMVHNYSSGSSGKGHEMKAQVEFQDRELNRAFRDIYKGFLTESEMDRVIDGYDLYFNEDEVLERWNKAKEL